MVQLLLQILLPDVLNLVLGSCFEFLASDLSCIGILWSCSVPSQPQFPLEIDPEHEGLEFSCIPRW